MATRKFAVDEGGGMEVFMRKVILGGIMAALVLSSGGCGQSKKIEVADLSEKNVIVTDFAVRLLQESFSKEENILISPVSVLSGVSLIANGVQGDSLAQIEEVVGLSADELNEYLYYYNNHLSEISDENNKFYLANSLWLNKDKNVSVSDEYLKKNKMYHDASVFHTSFTSECVDDTNKWISDQTDGAVSEVVNEISVDSSMYLVNGLVYEGVWPDKVHSGNTFTISFDKISSGNKELTIMHEREHFYLKDIGASGFMKYFEDEKYAFAAILPDEDTDIQTYVEGLTGERLHKVLSNPVHGTSDVGVWMPLFSFDYKKSMTDMLMNMGIENVFEKEKADFSGFGCIEENEELSLDQFLYATSIDIDENGTNTE